MLLLNKHPRPNRRTPSAALSLMVPSVFESFTGTTPQTYSDPFASAPLTSIEAALENFDLEQYASCIIEALPSVQQVEISVDRPRRRGRRVARLSPVHGERRVQTVYYTV